MPFLTALVLGGFVAYMAGWYFGAIEGNMALLLFMAVCVTGVYWIAEKFWFQPHRRKAAADFEIAQSQREASLAAKGVTGDNVNVAQTKERLLAEPWWLDWTAGLFPVILAVFLLRSFAYEPFKIPSGSMIPSLLIGDLILVNKYEWGLRMPVLNKKITQGTPVQRGEVMVFRYPPKPSVDYIKRVVGLPGDTVSYIDKKLSVNGKEIDHTPLPDFLDESTMQYYQQFQEQLGTHTHRILIDANRPAGNPVLEDFPQSESCRYSIEGVTCKVPAGHYFVMGDNRDNSADSRFWGFVPDDHIVGKAVAVWLNLGDLKRIGRIE